MVEAQQELLFRPEVETLFEQDIAHVRSAGDECVVELLEIHLALLQACKSVDIAQAFAQLTAEQEQAQPFDSELISRTVAALLGSPQQKMEHMQYLTGQLAQATDERLKALLQVIQLALFSNDLSQLGRDLQGVYREAWETIAATVERVAWMRVCLRQLPTIRWQCLVPLQVGAAGGGTISLGSATKPQHMVTATWQSCSMQ